MGPLCARIFVIGYLTLFHHTPFGESASHLPLRLPSPFTVERLQPAGHAAMRFYHVCSVGKVGNSSSQKARRESQFV